MFRSLMLLLASLVVVVTLVPHIHLWPHRRHSPGELAPSEPAQRDVGGGASWQAGKFRLTPLASYDITALAFSITHYWLGEDARLMPVDFAVGWGFMSDQSVVDDFSFSHGSRHFYFRCGDGKVPASCDEINTHVANMHLIPANKEISAQLWNVVAGQTVTLSGYLVRAEFPDGRSIASSLTRTDGGDGACEVMWVERISVQ